jgi:uncharacterized protein (DUF2235 family)
VSAAPALLWVGWQAAVKQVADYSCLLMLLCARFSSCGPDQRPLNSGSQEGSAMSKRLVICCDGTWNTPDQQSPTNVTKIALAVANTDGHGTEQRTFYHQGVGADPDERFRGGAFGYGLSRNVCDTYRFLVRHYEPGDQLFFFGFSRGAFTARSTAGLVRNCGILRRSEIHRVDDAYALYRSRASEARPRGVESVLFRRSYSHEPRIRFIGVWDTVGALGIPIDGLPLAGKLNRRWGFHDTTLSGIVDAAYQALAIDERRGPFRPALWAQQKDAPEGQILQQVWFTGVHCDVGGGNPQHKLSDLPLLWMVSRARQSGLCFEAAAFGRGADNQSALADDDENIRRLTGVAPDPFGAFDDSRTGAYRFLPSSRRKIGVTERGHESVASSAVARFEGSADYRPLGLVDYQERGTHGVMPLDGVLAPL